MYFLAVAKILFKELKWITVVLLYGNAYTILLTHMVLSQLRAP